MPNVKLGESLKCPKCKHEWLPRQTVVDRCPRCQKWLVKEGEK